MRRPLWETLSLFKKPNIHLLIDLATQLLGISPKEMNKYAYTKTRTKIFIAVLFTIAPKMEIASFNW